MLTSIWRALAVSYSLPVSCLTLVLYVFYKPPRFSSATQEICASRAISGKRKNSTTYKNIFLWKKFLDGKYACLSPATKQHKTLHHGFSYRPGSIFQKKIASIFPRTPLIPLISSVACLDLRKLHYRRAFSLVCYSKDNLLRRHRLVSQACCGQNP